MVMVRLVYPSGRKDFGSCEIHNSLKLIVDDLHFIGDTLDMIRPSKLEVKLSRAPDIE